MTRRGTVYMLLFTHWHLCRPQPPVTNVGLCSTSDFINFDQNCHHFYSCSAGGKDRSSNIQIMILKHALQCLLMAPFFGEPIVPAIHGKPFLISDVITIYLCFDWKNSEKNFPQLHLATLRVIRISCFDDAFSEIAETRKLPQKDRCRKRNGKKKKIKIMIKEKKRELNP